MRDRGQDPLVIALDSPHTRQFATLYQGLAEVQFVAGPIPNTPETDEPVCFSQRILNAHGIRDASPIPFVEISEQEKRWARDLLAAQGFDDPSKLIVWAPTVGGARADLPGEHIANYRRLPWDRQQFLLDRARAAGRIHLRFGTRHTQTHIYRNHDDRFPGLNTPCLPDLALRQVAACYAVIGLYEGADTGDHHLMLAAGGYCRTHVPPSTWFYPHVKHHYGPDAWRLDGSSYRECYVRFDRAMPTILS